MKHSERILQILKEEGLTPYKVAKETGISESTFSKWKKNPTSEISSKVLQKIADYLNCSTDYLIGRTKRKEKRMINKSCDNCELNSGICMGKYYGEECPIKNINYEECWEQSLDSFIEEEEEKDKELQEIQKEEIKKYIEENKNEILIEYLKKLIDKT